MSHAKCASIKSAYTCSFKEVSLARNPSLPTHTLLKRTLMPNDYVLNSIEHTIAQDNEMMSKELPTLATLPVSGPRP